MIIKQIISQKTVIWKDIFQSFEKTSYFAINNTTLKNIEKRIIGRFSVVKDVSFDTQINMFYTD